MCSEMPPPQAGVLVHGLCAVAGATQHFSLYLKIRLKPQIVDVLSLNRPVLVPGRALVRCPGARSLPSARCLASLLAWR